MRVIVTRPAHEAATWVAALQAAGHEAIALPLIEIAPVADPRALQAAWQHWSQWDAVMFVSAQAVRLFFAQRLVPTPDASHLPRCWATGPGTRRALLEAGVPASHIDCPPEDALQFDSPTLWQSVRMQVHAGQSVLIVRGGDAATRTDPTGAGRDWLGEQLKAQGVAVQWLAAYERRAPQWTAAQHAQASAAAHDGSVWVLSSSQAIAHLAHCLPQTQWHQARAVTTHPRIGQAAQALGFGHVMQVRPVLAEVVASLECFA